jgi:hypothetical protein
MAEVDAEATVGRDAHLQRRRRLVPLMVLLGVLLTQFAWAWGTPPFRGIDEIDHAFRAASVALGDVRPTRLPVDGRGAVMEVPPDLVAAAHRQCESLTYDGRSNCVPEATLPDGNDLIASSAAAYSPAFYAVIGTIAKPWHGVTALYVMRGASCLINAVLLSLATWCLLTRSRTAWPVTGLALGLTPMAVYTTMLPAPNGIELAAATLLWCSLLALQRAQPRIVGRLLAAGGLAGGILGCVRPTGPIFVLLILVMVTLVDRRGTLALVGRRWRGVLAAAAVTGLATLCQVVWVVTHPAVREMDTRRSFDLGVILEQTVLWVFQWIGAFPLRENPTSPVTYVACLTAFAVVFAESLKGGDAKRWVALSVIVGSLALPLVFTLGTFTAMGSFWQGRYALPFLIGAPILLGFALDRSACQNRAVPIVVAGCGFLATSAAVIQLVHLEHYSPASSDDPHWHAPWPVAVIVLAAVAAWCFSSAMTWSGTGLPAAQLRRAGSATPADRDVDVLQVPRNARMPEADP